MPEPYDAAARPNIDRTFARAKALSLRSALLFHGQTCDKLDALPADHLAVLSDHRDAVLQVVANLVEVLLPCDFALLEIGRVKVVGEAVDERGDLYNLDGSRLLVQPVPELYPEGYSSEATLAWMAEEVAVELASRA
jgi:hypothetical protein